MSVLDPQEIHSSAFASMRGDHVGLRVADLDEALRWYADKLAFRRMGDMPFNDLMFAFIAPMGNDDLRLELLAGPGAEPRPSHDDLVGSLHLRGWHHVCLRVDGVDDAVAELKRRGVEIVLEPTDVAAIRSRIAFFADPWANLFELIQPMTSAPPTATSV